MAGELDMQDADRSSAKHDDGVALLDARPCSWPLMTQASGSASAARSKLTLRGI